MCNNLIDKASAALALGKGERLDWTAQLPASVLLRANYCLFQLFKNPAAGVYSGAALNAQTVTGGTTPSLTSGLLNFLDPTAPDQSYLLYGECQPMSANLGNLIIFDLLAYYPGLNMNTAVNQPLIGAASVLPARLASGRGAMFMLDTTATLGAAAANAVVTYTNRNGSAGQLTPSTAMVVSSPVGRIPHSQFILPLDVGDDGVQSAQNFKLSGAMAAGTAALSLIKPLVSIPVPANYSTSSGIGSRSWFVDPLDITEVLTGAALCAVFIPSASVANTQLLGHLKNVRFNPN